MFRTFTATAILTILLLPGALHAESVLSAPPLSVGEDERIDGVDPCSHEAEFVAGTVSTATNLRVGGNSYGCDSEWGVSAEFDLSAFPPDLEILSATYVVRKTGYGDGGLPYVAVFPYEADGGAHFLPRADLDMDTALDIAAPPRLFVTTESPVPDQRSTWGAVKSIYE